MKTLAAALCLSFGVTTLSGCSHPLNCVATYRGGCAPGAESPAGTRPKPPPTTATRGDPRDFADVDDKQCRSYGLIFGSRDYADCRIRLSAQHRGLDPDLGAPVSSSGNQ